MISNNDDRGHDVDSTVHEMGYLSVMGEFVECGNRAHGLFVWHDW